ncbi:MAG TPA: MMPL family transporter, partial [Mycobacterium sp.]|nr:MMPL family transporter [Mycobacterium sp.]
MTGTISTQKTQRTFFARTIRKFSLLVVLAWIALLVVINVIVPQLEPVTKANQRPLVPLDAPSSKALIQVGEVFKESDSNSLVMVVLEGTDKLDETDHAFYDELVAKLQHDKHVQYVMNLWGEGTTAAGVQSNDGKASYTMVRVAGNQGSTQSNESIDAVRDLISHNKSPPGLNVYVSGSAPLSADMVEAGNKSMFKIMFVTIVLITTMLLIVYRSITTALLVLFMVMMELSCGRGIVSFLVFHKFIGTSVYSSNLLVSLILGAGTDYAIFLIGRYHEARHAGEDRETAYYSAVSGVSHVILGSGVAVAGATFCLKFTRLNYFSTCGIPCAVGLLTAVAAALTFGPALLALGSRVGIFDPKRPAGVGIWRKVGT